MQITRAEVTPVVLKLREPMQMAGLREIQSITGHFYAGWKLEKGSLLPGLYGSSFLT